MFYMKHLVSLVSLFSDGGGRSGVYLSVDANMELGEEEDKFDVFGYLKKLRQSRMGMVENVVRILFTFTGLFFDICYVCFLVY